MTAWIRFTARACVLQRERHVNSSKNSYTVFHKHKIFVGWCNELQMGKLTLKWNFTFPCDISYLELIPSSDMGLGKVDVWFVVRPTTPRGIRRLDGARGKKQVWRPCVRAWCLSEGNALYWRKYLWRCWYFATPLQWSSSRVKWPLFPFVTPLSAPESQ